jgi:tight adherence protein C
MSAISALTTLVGPVAMFSMIVAVAMFALMMFFSRERSLGRSRLDVRKRLDVAGPASAARKKSAQPAVSRRAANHIVRRTNDFYASNDPQSIRKIQMRLIQGGFLHENAIGYFFAARIALAVAGGVFWIALILFVTPEMAIARKISILLGMSLSGYFMPNFYLKKRIGALQRQNRAGFPDVLDLMIVAAEAGLTMEASIDRIAREIERTHPSLSRQLTLAGIEIRAGRPLDQALRAFGERLGLEEVRGFATMIQQSKELGTSVSDALRVYSDEMRHRRMMVAEERAYALPAKLSVPVTAFILPVIIGVAILPTVIRLIHE